jgi:uncharacterized protein YdbL (DUF1318 family)
MGLSWRARHSIVAKALAGFVLVSAAGGALMLAPRPASAQSAATKAMVDAGKARGIIGEQGDGFLGFVTPSTDPALAAAVAEINQGARWSIAISQ